MVVAQDLETGHGERRHQRLPNRKRERRAGHEHHDLAGRRSDELVIGLPRATGKNGVPLTVRAAFMSLLHHGTPLKPQRVQPKRMASRYPSNGGRPDNGQTLDLECTRARAGVAEGLVLTSASDFH